LSKEEWERLEEEIQMEREVEAEEERYKAMAARHR